MLDFCEFPIKFINYQTLQFNCFLVFYTKKDPKGLLEDIFEFFLQIVNIEVFTKEISK
jgi:hypothetical protein